MDRRGPQRTPPTEGAQAGRHPWLLEVEAETDFPALLRAVRAWRPEESVLYFEGGSPNDLLADLAERCAEPELAVHFHAYRDGEVLLEWHDAFTQPMLLAASLDENTVREFATALGATFEKTGPRDAAATSPP